MNSTFKPTAYHTVCLFLGGVLFGTAGIKILSSKDAKKAYVQCTAAALRKGQRYEDRNNSSGKRW